MELRNAAKAHGSMRSAAKALGMPWSSFWEAVKLEDARGQATTQIDPKQCLIYEAPADFDLFLSSDHHYGHEDCHYEGLRTLVDMVGDTPNARLILGGDQCEITPQGYHDGGRNSDRHIDEQIVGYSRLFRPVAGKIDLMLAGNHGKKRLVKAGIDPDLIIAGNLEAPYSAVPKVVRYKTPRGSFQVCVGHGNSGAQNSLLDLQRLQRGYPGCELYNLGHDHNLFAERAGAMIYDEKGREQWDGTWLCRSGSMSRFPEYARYALYQPKPTGFLVARVRGGQIVTVEVVKT